MDIRFLLETYEGRKFLWCLMHECGTFVANSSLSENLQFKEGKRAIGLTVLDIVFTTDANSFTLMYKEQEEREEHERAKRDTEREQERDERDGRPSEEPLSVTIGE